MVSQVNLLQSSVTSITLRSNVEILHYFFPIRLFTQKDYNSSTVRQMKLRSSRHRKPLRSFPVNLKAQLAQLSSEVSVSCKTRFFNRAPSGRDPSLDAGTEAAQAQKAGDRRHGQH